MEVTWVDVVSLIVLVISSGATIWVAVVAASTSRSAASTAKLALEAADARDGREDRAAIAHIINDWAISVGQSVTHGQAIRGISAELGTYLAAVPGSEPIVEWYLDHANRVVAAIKGQDATSIRTRIKAEQHLQPAGGPYTAVGRWREVRSDGLRKPEDLSAHAGAWQRRSSSPTWLATRSGNQLSGCRAPTGDGAEIEEEQDAVGRLRDRSIVGDADRRTQEDRRR